MYLGAKTRHREQTRSQSNRSIMLKPILSFAGTIFAGTLWIGGRPLAAQAQPSPATASSAPQFRATLNKYCVTCHNEKLKTAGLSLEKLDVANAPAGAEVWEQVIRKLRGNAMPPPKLPRPDDS